MLFVITGLCLATLLASSLVLYRSTRLVNGQIRQEARSDQTHALFEKTLSQLAELQEKITQQIHDGQMTGMKHLHESLQDGLQRTQRQVTDVLKDNTEHLNARVDKLTGQVDERLKAISGEVEKRLSEGFEKTTATFTDIIKRLALIDEAQKKITELSTNVVSLQEILSDKRSRGAFGEVQLTALLRNVLPEQHISFQHTLSNGKRADCILFLPEPTGNVVIDAKFPLESFRNLAESSPASSERKGIETQCRLDMRKHIQDIANKYIIADETADGAVMFIPAESIFAEIHAHFPDIVEQAHRAKVWLVSPTTMMAILTTARAVLKDEQTRKQVHIIQEHLIYLAKDFQRFQKRMDNLAKHIQQANDDVADVHRSAKKITSRFDKIEKVELHDEAVNALSATEVEPE